MVACEFELVSAYFDDELPAIDRAGVEEHLRECSQCAGDLNFLRESSQLLKTYPFEDLNKQELSRLHAAIDESADQRSIWRIGTTLSAAAASLLIISGAWLMELPAPASRGGSVAAAEPWERTAITLRLPEPVTPLRLNDHDSLIHLADARLADWMLYRLSRDLPP